MNAQTEIAPGDLVEIRDVFGVWHGAVALSAPRIDAANAIRRMFFSSVSVAIRGWEHPVNWPTEETRLATKEASRRMAEAVLADPELRSCFEAMVENSAIRVPTPDDFKWLREESP